MKVYLAGSIHGGREFADNLRLIAGHLSQMGHEILTEFFVVDLSEDDFGPDRDETKIVARDRELVEEADVFIAEVSQSSHGVGYEHRHAEENGKPILLLRHNSLSAEPTVSSFLRHKLYPKLRFAYYDETNVQGLLENFFDEFYREGREGRVAKERE